MGAKLFVEEMHVFQRFHLTQLLNPLPGCGLQILDCLLLLLSKQLLDHLLVHLDLLFRREVMIDRLLDFGGIEVEAFVTRESGEPSPTSGSAGILRIRVVRNLSRHGNLLFALSSVFRHNLGNLFVHVLWRSPAEPSR